MPPKERERQRSAEPAAVAPPEPAAVVAPNPSWPSDRTDRLAKLIAKAREIEAERLANYLEVGRLNDRNVELTQALTRLKSEVTTELWAGKPPE